MLTESMVLALLAGIGVSPLGAVAQRRAGPALRIGLLFPAGSRGDLRRGVEMGVAEAMRAAELIGARVTPAFAAELSTLHRAGCTVVISASAAPAAAHSAALSASERGIVLLNVGAASDSLRAAECGEYLFHVVPSESMRLYGGERLVAWDPRLTRFGAEQLNDRYRHRFRAAMTEHAWCGWMAAKIAWEAVARTGSADAGTVRAHLLRGATGFDGHKGRALRFAARDRQLYQPMYRPADLREVLIRPVIPSHGTGRCAP